MFRSFLTNSVDPDQTGTVGNLDSPLLLSSAKMLKKLFDSVDPDQTAPVGAV